ncbi:MAG: IPT/TIG domain-containing protein [Tenuifilaceae bacterium]|jgi:hypothetical protein|nr:IPT/TIG domain-containing protein [Tenuifilaceae bacterium]
MKAFKYIKIPTLVVAAFLMAVTISCEESGPLSIDPVEVQQPFTFQPDHGYPGQTVKISGTGLNDVLKVSFANREALISSKTDQEINVEIPVGATTGQIKLVKAKSIVTSVDIFTVDLTPVPSIIDFTPAIAGSGQEVTITGNLFTEVDSVYIGDLKAEIKTGVTDNTMKIETPAGLQTGYIKMYYNYMTSYGIEKVGESVSSAQLTLALPTIESITPNIASLNVGDELTIIGNMMNEVTQVLFGTLDATFTIVNETELTAIVPIGATTGKIVLVVPDGTVESGTFTVNLPTISSFTPTKGQDAVTRVITIVGAKLDLVESVTVGSAAATIETQSPTVLVITAVGSSTGQIGLHTPNGSVYSSGSFVLTGDFWVNDWDTVFDTQRFSRFQNNGFASFTETVMADNGNNYVELAFTGESNKSIYMWGEGATDDKFFMYTSSPNGVYLQFDMKVSAIEEHMKQDDGTFKFKIYLMDSKGWGASGEYAYGYNGPTSFVRTDGEWQTFKQPLWEYKASSNSGLYTADQVGEGDLRPDAFVHPNSLRIITFVFGFPGDPGSAAVGLDNVKFVIE